MNRITSQTVSARRSTRAPMYLPSAALLLLAAPFQTAAAQDARAREEMMRARPRIEATRIPDVLSLLRSADPKRAAIGVTMAESNRSDTLGVLVSEVTPGSPADKAGVKKGARITAINGVSLRISALDADDPELAGLGQRRLQRELGKANPGDDVELRIATGSGTQTVKMKTVSAADLETRTNAGRITSVWPAGEERRVSIGGAIGSSGSVRDTLGLFISSVTTGGPAEKAGIYEGDRIAAINGIDVRLPKEDAEDMQASMARVNRFRRELYKLAPGEKATLRVFGGGRYRDVEVTLANAAELRSNNFMFNFGDGPAMMSLPRIEGLSMPGGTIRRVMPASTVRRIER